MRNIAFEQTWALYAYDGLVEQRFWIEFDQTNYLHQLGYTPVRHVKRCIITETYRIQLIYSIDDEAATMFLLKFPQTEDPVEIEIEYDPDYTHPLILRSEITRTNYE